MTVGSGGLVTRRCLQGGKDQCRLRAFRPRRTGRAGCVDTTRRCGSRRAGRVRGMVSALTEPVRFGLLGYGSGGRHFHAPLIASAPECAFVAVATTSSDRRSQVAGDHPTVEVCDSLDDLVAIGVEAVTISTPAHTHTELTEAALRRGLAVVCDKPFALDAASAAGTVALAEDLERVLSPYQNRRWDSDFLTMQALVRSERLGSLARLESRFERFAPERGPKPAGGGTLLDFGSHLVDQALVLLGPVATVYAEWRLRESGLDDDVFVALTHRSGTHSMLWCSWSQTA